MFIIIRNSSRCWYSEFDWVSLACFDERYQVTRYQVCWTPTQHIPHSAATSQHLRRPQHEENSPVHSSCSISPACKGQAATANVQLNMTKLQPPSPSKKTHEGQNPAKMVTWALAPVCIKDLSEQGILYLSAD